MDPTAVPIFALAERRLAWLDRRAATLAGNVANADTPGYRPRDLSGFLDSMQHAGLEAARTNTRHLVGTLPAVGTVPIAGEVAPDGNGVSLDTQLLRMAETDAAHDLVGELFRKYVGMFKAAAGR